MRSYLDVLINEAILNQKKAIHPENYGGGVSILFRDTDEGLHTFSGYSIRCREKPIRDCAEKMALEKLMEMFETSESGLIEAVAISAAVRTDKDCLCALLDVRPPCESCRKMLAKNVFIQATTPLILINPGKSLVIQPISKLLKLYGKNYWD